MATFRILVLVSKIEIRSREFSFLSRCLRLKIINLDLVSMPEIGRDIFSVSSRSLRLSVRNSRSRLDVRDWIREILILVSRMKTRVSLTSAVNIPQSQHLRRTKSLKIKNFYSAIAELMYQHHSLPNLVLINFRIWAKFQKNVVLRRKKWLFIHPWTALQSTTASTGE